MGPEIVWRGPYQNILSTAMPASPKVSIATDDMQYANPRILKDQAMSLTFHCAAPADLLRSFKAKINQAEEKGKIDTWEISDDGKYFTHKAPRWRALAWFWAEVVNEGLRFNIAPSEGQTVSVTAYSYYHGHLTETFLNHFDHNFRLAVSTAQIDTNDRVK